jgi:uncharacterized membrane protein (DUF485 family)
MQCGPSLQSKEQVVYKLAYDNLLLTFPTTNRIVMSSPESLSSDTPSAERLHNAALGLKLFVLYLVLYLGFVLINAFAANLMETEVFSGLNLAIVYGFGLIIFAIVLAMIYGLMCQREPVETSASSEADSASSEGENE